MSVTRSDAKTRVDSPELLERIEAQERELTELRERLARWEAAFARQPQRQAETTTISGVPVASLYTPADREPGWDYLEQLGDDALTIFVEHSRIIPPGTHIQSAMLPAGGAVKDVGEDETPLTSRHADWHMHPFCIWERPEDDQACIGWARGIRAALKPYTTGGVYLNFIGDEGAQGVRLSYNPDTRARLATLEGGGAAACFSSSISHGF